MAFFSSSHSSFCMRIGSEMWSEYLRMIDLSLQADSSSSSPVAQVQGHVGAAAARSVGSTVNSPSPSRFPAHAFAPAPARRVTTVTRSATMKPE